MLENPTAQDRPAVKKAKTLYRSCMNESECGRPSGLRPQGLWLCPPPHGLCAQASRGAWACCQLTLLTP